MQNQGSTIFTTFATAARWSLPDAARDLVMASIVHDHNRQYVLHAAVVMINHVHVLMTPLSDDEGNLYGLAQIMQAVKGASAHAINRALSRTGAVWQAESFDTSLRRDEKHREKAAYICQNPVRASRVLREDDWPWVWREWVEGIDERLSSADEWRRRGRLRSISENSSP